MASAASQRFEAIVVGLGAHGSAALYNLAKWGSRVLGLERYGIGHANASHHGLTRITRLAYMEGPEYVPLLHKSFACYETLERESRTKLYTRTGVLNMGRSVFGPAHATAVAQALPHEVLTGRQASQRWPGLNLPPDMPVLFEEAGGILEPEKMIAAHVDVARHHGATVRTGEQVLAWRPLSDGGVEVTTDKGAYTADKLVLAGGAWMEQLVPELKGLCVPGRATVAWVDVQQPAWYSPGVFPVYIMQDEDSGSVTYGFPEFGGKPGVKIGLFCTSHSCDPDNLARAATEADTAPLLAMTRKFFSAAAGPVLDFAACMFVNTPDGHFIIDTHPRHPQVILCSACSGHGFKLSPAVGLVLADMVRHDGRCAEFEQQLRLHKLDRRRPGHAEVLDRFAASAQ